MSIRRFSVGLWDSLFGERIEIEMPSKEGKINRIVTKKWFEQMQNQGKAKQLITAHVYDPSSYFLNPEGAIFIEAWELNKDIDEKTYEELKDDNGDIYVLNHFDNGELRRFVLAKDLWLQVQEDYEEI